LPHCRWDVTLAARRSSIISRRAMITIPTSQRPRLRTDSPWRRHPPQIRTRTITMVRQMCLWKMQIRTTGQNILQDRSTNVVRQASISLIKARPPLSVTPQWICSRLPVMRQVLNPSRRTLPSSTSHQHLGNLPPGRITLRTLHSITKTPRVSRLFASSSSR
jgi:hypothetical protein